jgi:putative acetyltransferase
MAETIWNFKNVFFAETRGLELEPNDGNLFAKCKRFGFEKCYLETMPFMLDAKNYTKSRIRIHLFSHGSTGHMSPI